MLISLVFSVSSDPQGQERVPWVYAKAPWTIEISNLKKFTPFFLQFINTAISEDMMIVNNSLESSISEVKTQNVLVLEIYPEASVIFVEIPAFNHSDLAMQMKLPYLISRWLTKTSYVSPLFLSWCEYWKSNYVASTETASQMWYHLLAFKFNGFTKNKREIRQKSRSIR